MIQMGERILKGKKVYTINVRVQPFLYKWLKQLEREGEIGNISDIVRTALFEYKIKRELEEKEKEWTPDRLIKIIKGNPELKEKVLKALQEG
ncbi:hypothetical protein [Candidatus Pyrohabitans sp.]